MNSARWKPLKSVCYSTADVRYFRVWAKTQDDDKWHSENKSSLSVLQLLFSSVLRSLSKEETALPQSPLMPLRHLWTLQQGCRTLHQKQGHQQVSCSKLPLLFTFLPAATFFNFPLKASVHTYFGGLMLSDISGGLMLSLLSDNTAWLVTLNNCPSLRSEFTFLHHFLQATGRILEDKCVSVFNDNVLPGFSDL